ncbi:helix-turn-helix domain-containing protein [Leptotrichia buccalis]|uniref:Transcriptional regulator, XRE family n=1 Tax=Leptotrichia buccalis (strain ATCC 14201 / DSM 1135 / JCM 12969 / NCTC 10249 / C-1013-b) TaxID=523794 RepID=C7N9B8_LEPBD|nr:helix-turn-helix transcriptional regulator [Leptotrichia buccalis]ACV38749.1 transcriptional regulator, XRE family [Leptotrichia buccalis C-1013-b]
MSKYFRDSLNEQLKDEEFRKEYESLEAEFQIIREIISARKDKNITQKELSDLTGITQGDISKIENGNANPSLKTLKKLAAAFDKKLVISFE